MQTVMEEVRLGEVRMQVKVHLLARERTGMILVLCNTQRIMSVGDTPLLAACHHAVQKSELRVSTTMFSEPAWTFDGMVCTRVFRWSP